VKRWAKWSAGSVLGLALTAYLGICAYMFAIQRSLVFRPDTSDISSAVSMVPGAEALRLVTNDGERLVAWWKPPADAARPVYLYLHGNGANLARRAARYNALTANGAGLLALSWRGYGGSTGEPSEAGMRRDAEAGHAWLAGAGIEPRRIILFGESLGTGVATWLAARRPAAGLILDSPYASIVEIGARRYPWLPVRLLARDRFDAVAEAGKVRVPVLASICRNDWLTPSEDALRLMSAFPQPPEYRIIERRCHVPPLSEALLPALPAFLAQLGLPAP
jgi:pimeloyl-ACP methyl ester carboxylesterase